MEGESQAVKDFKQFAGEPDTAVAVAAIRALAGVIGRCSATTMMGLQKELESAAEQLRAVDPTISLISGTELFLRFVTRASVGTTASFEECKRALLKRANMFLDASMESRKAIGKVLVERFFRDGMTVLVHGLSRVVLECLITSAKQNKVLNVYVTECRTPMQNFGREMASRIVKSTGFSVQMVVDSSVARIMQEVDIVVFGAEGVVENGGIINTVGTYQIALVAAALNTPVYVAVESFKFVRHFPLSQDDVPQFRVVDVAPELRELEKRNEGQVHVVTHTHDYTPPKYISLLFTDVGILTPAAVSDQLIKLYH